MSVTREIKPATAPPRGLPPQVSPAEIEFQKLKAALHQQLVASLDLSAAPDSARLRKQVRALAEEACRKSTRALSLLERERMLDDLLDEIFGLGPLEPLLRDHEVSDVLVNDPYTVYVERRGQIERTDVVFADENHLRRVIQRIVARLGRRIDDSSPMVDARLPDGSRVNAVLPPLSLSGPVVSIRRFGLSPLQIDDLLANGSLSREIVDVLRAAVQARIGCLISGGTGAGKTTLLNAASAFIPDSERIITIEDAAELALRNRHWVRLESRPSNTEGQNEVTSRDLVRNSLRMRPDRIIVGEVRGPEVWDMLQAMNTGHEGALTTVHANSAADALRRLELMAAMSGLAIPVTVLREYIATGIRLIVHAARLAGGARRVVQVSELAGSHDGRYEVHDIVTFQQSGVDDRGRAVGEFRVHGHHPAELIERMESLGVRVPAIFQNSQAGSD